MPRDLRAYPAANRIAGFRKQLTHEYANVDDALVWGVIERDLADLRSESGALLRELDEIPSDTDAERASLSGRPPSVIPSPSNAT